MHDAALSLKSKCNSKVANIDGMKCFVDTNYVTHR